MNNLQDTAKLIRDWQLARGISDSELCRRFDGLGSTKTFKRILEGDLSELDLDKWSVTYDQVWALISIETATTRIEEPIYDDLKHTKVTRAAFLDVYEERGNNRLVIIEGPSGSGKTTAARCLAEKYGSKIILTEADETWKDNKNAMLAGILRSLRVREIPPSCEARKTKLIERLNDSPVCLLIDEAHHLGPATLNLVKTILNQTRCQIIFLCIETLFKKLECSAYEEAKQLTKNRLSERVAFGAPTTPDIETFLSRRVTFEPAALRPAAQACAAKAPIYGHWNFVHLVARRAKTLSGKTPVDLETFAQAMVAVENTRNPKR
jgi:energy-coupling factor transporter ATP-binding protein EcfA2